MCVTTRIGALIVVAPDQARAEILAAIDAAEGNRTRAAEILGANLRTLQKWIERLGMYPDIDALCERKGYHVQPGPARKSQRKNVKATKRLS